jgi:hypothetical protein
VNTDPKEFKFWLYSIETVSNTWIAKVNTTYRVVMSPDMVAHLPANPQLGDYVEIYDAYTPTGSSCGSGFLVNPLKVQASPNFWIEGSLFYFLTKAGEYLKFVYIGCETWRIIRAGSESADQITEYVTSVNDLSGKVTLTTQQIPETQNRLYLNTSRFLSFAAQTSLASFQDVDYDVTIYQGNVLSWDVGLNKFVPRSPLATVYLGDMVDVVIRYHEDREHPSSRGFSSETGSDPLESYNDELLSPELVWDENTQTSVLQYVPTGLYLYRRDWYVGWQDNDLAWSVMNRMYADQRTLLSSLQDVEIPISDSHYLPTISIQHGQVLQWDSVIHRWKPGAFADLRDTDDLPEGEINLYLSSNNLLSVAPQVLELGHLKGVSDNLVGMTGLTHPLAVVLGWNPSEAEWNTVAALTEDATTANIDEAISAEPDPPWDVSLTRRGYFTGRRVQATLNTWGTLDWFSDVSYPFGLSHGDSLIYSSTRGWIAGNPTTAVTTDDLPEGAINLYYTYQRAWDVVDGYADTYIQPSINYHEDVQYSNPIQGQSLIWDSQASSFRNGYPVALPIQAKGDLIVGTGLNAFSSLGVGMQGQYLRTDYNAPNYVSWQDLDNIFTVKTLYPDLPHQTFIRAKDLSDSIVFLGTSQGQSPVADFQNPTQAGLLSIYFASDGIPIHRLTDRTFYSSTPSVTPGVNNSPTATLTNLTSNLVIAFNTTQAYRLERFVFQAKVTGSHTFKVSYSNDAIVWTTFEDFSFELSEDMLFTEGVGLNSQIIDSDASLANRNFYLINLPFLTSQFQDTQQSLGSFFYRYYRIEPFQTTTPGVVALYEISLYGWVNSNSDIHKLVGSESDHFLITGVPNCELFLPGSVLEATQAGILPGFSTWLVVSAGTSVNIYSNNSGRVYNNLTNELRTSTDPLIVPPNSLVNIVYAGVQTIFDINSNPISILKWHVSVLGAGGGSGGGGGGADPLNRLYHYGTQPVSSITGLAPVAISNSYNDLADLPLLHPIAAGINAGQYSQLTGTPTLGTAASKDVGTLAGQVLMFGEDNKLPILDGSNLTNLGIGSVTNLLETILTSKGQMLVHNGLDVVSFGTTLIPNGYALTVDSNSPEGIKWSSVSSLASDAATLNGFDGSYYLDLAHQTGLLSTARITGLSPLAYQNQNIWTNLTGKPLFKSAALLDAGTLAGQVLLLAENGKLPILDGSNLTNIASPLSAPGDLIVRSLGGVDASLPIGFNGQILTVELGNPSNPLLVKWSDLASFTNAALFNSQAPAYYLNRANHTGTQLASTISGLHLVATSGDYLDLDNRPNLHLVATSGSYLDLDNRPTLGTAALLNVGTSPFNIPQLNSQAKILTELLNAGTLAGQVLLLTENGKLPVLDGSNLTGITTSPTVLTLSTTSILQAGRVIRVGLNSSGGTFSITLPATPVQNDEVSFIDLIGSNPLTPTGLGLNKVTLLPNTGHTIQGYASVDLDDENTSVSLIFKGTRWNISQASF